MIAGLVGSIDNDMVGTDMTIGADSALHRIVEAIDAIGQHGGQPPAQLRRRGDGPALRLPGADERDRRRRRLRAASRRTRPTPGWEDDLCELLKSGRAAGRRNSIVVVAEGAHDSRTNPITSEYVRQVLEDRLGEDTRVTILGHVQRGGAPSAFDRSMSSIARLRRRRGGAGAPTADSVPQLIGIRDNRVAKAPLMECVARTRELAELIAAKDYDTALAHARRQLHRDGRTSSTRSRTPCPA